MNHDPPDSDQLQLNKTTTPFPAAACSGSASSHRSTLLPLAAGWAQTTHVGDLYSMTDLPAASTAAGDGVPGQAPIPSGVLGTSDIARSGDANTPSDFPARALRATAAAACGGNVRVIGTVRFAAPGCTEDALYTQFQRSTCCGSGCGAPPDLPFSAAPASVVPPAGALVRAIGTDPTGKTVLLMGGIGIGSSFTTDADLDGVPDLCDNCPSVANYDQGDADHDGRGDTCDPCPADANNDADRDGLCADVDPCPGDSANDADHDGVCGDADNCPLDFNPGQEDADGDGRGDACDAIPCYAVETSVSPASRGVVLPSAASCDLVEFQAGREVRLTAVAADGVQFAGWTGDLSSTANPLTVRIGGNLTLTANFVPVPSCLLSVDGNTSADVATDVVYIARHLLGLTPVPPDFRVLDPSIPPDATVAAAIDAISPALDVDTNGTLDVATDVVYIARHLLGLTPVPTDFRLLDPTIPPDTAIDAIRPSRDVDMNGVAEVATDIVYIARYLVGLTPVPPDFRDLVPIIPPDAAIAAKVDALCPGP